MMCGIMCPRSRLVSAVWVCIAPKLWRVVLDGEIDGVPFTEAYGRDRRAIRGLQTYDGHRSKHSSEQSCATRSGSRCSEL